MKGLFTQFGNRGDKLATHVDTSADWTSGKISVHTDDLGLRCDDERKTATKPGDAIDVLFVGDSQGFGNGVNFEDTIAGTGAMAALGSSYHMANVSVGGHSMMQQLELVKWLVDKEGVRVSRYVLLVTPALLTECDNYNRAAVGSDGRLYDKPKSRYEMAIIYLKSHAVVYSRIRNAVRNAGIGVVPTRDAPFLFHVFGAGLDEQKVRASFSECVSQLRNFAAEHNAQLSLVYVPLTVEVDFTPVSQAAASRGIELDPDLPLRICSSVGSSLNLPLLNLRPVLAGLHAEGQPLHLRGDYHYNQTISRACGLSVWKWLEPVVGQRRSAAQL
jgi:hypothetical protein